ncbi:MAG TPA: choice-of-anchor D domain-containing protein [Terriglobales bacterium]
MVTRFALATSVALLLACGGSGGGGGGVPNPAIQILPTSLDFGAVPMGKTSAAQNVTVFNTGNTTFRVSPYSHASTCSASSLNSLASCSIAVTFGPSAIGPANGTLLIGTTDPALQGQLQLKGSGDYTFTPKRNYNITITGTSGPVTAQTSSSFAVQ